MGNFAMGVAIEKAKETGVGWVTVKGSNHFGIAGHYSAQALQQNMLGMAFTNGSPYVAPTRSATSTLSTLPVSLASPGLEGYFFNKFKSYFHGRSPLILKSR